jgi:hypothetical protein
MYFALDPGPGQEWGVDNPREEILDLAGLDLGTAEAGECQRAGNRRRRRPQEESVEG